MNGIVHRYDDGSWKIGSLHLAKGQELPRSMMLDKAVFFFTSSIKMEDWKDLLDDQDRLFGPEPGKIFGVDIFIPSHEEDGKSGMMRFLNAKLWSIAKKESLAPMSLLQSMAEKFSLYVYNGAPRLGNSLAGTAMNWYMNIFNGKTIDRVFYPDLRVLAPRWRELPAAAFHGGPIACLRGGSDYAVEIDIKGAYLNALTKEVPILLPGQQYTYFHDNIPWNQLREYFGFVEATVFVPHELQAGLPPLPISTGTGIKYPVGLFRGAWTIGQLKEAEELYDVRICQLHQHMVTNNRMPLFRALSHHWAHMANQDVAKSMYTRFWGKFGFRGGYTGFSSEEPIRGTIPKDFYYWRDDRIDQLSEDREIFYRPDIAAMIASYNHRAVQRALRMLKPESIIAVHVDAIWTDDLEGAERICREILPDPETNTGHWRVKKRGKLRFWGCGVYDHNGKIGYSGFSTDIHGRVTHNKLDRWMQGSHSRIEVERNRRWDRGVSSAKSRNARSIASKLKQSITYPVTNGIPIPSPVWTTQGWVNPEYRDRI